MRQQASVFDWMAEQKKIKVKEHFYTFNQSCEASEAFYAGARAKIFGELELVPHKIDTAQCSIGYNYVIPLKFMI
jgi:hypothetical protein